MVIRRVSPLPVWVDYFGGGGLGEVGAVAAGELSRRNRYTPHDPLWVPIMFRCARVVVCPTGPRSTAPVCEVVECAELSGLVGGHWGLPEW